MSQDKKGQAETTETVKRKAKAVLYYLRYSPRKMRLVIDTIRNKPVAQAAAILMTFQKKGARMAEKLLKSAVANAKVLKMDEAKLYVSKVHADGGPTFKRVMSRSMGRADRITKRTTHLTMEVSEGTRSWTKPSGAASGKEEKGKGAKSKKVSKKKAAGTAA